MKISDNGLALIKRFEGCSLKAYQDCVGVWTIGWGTTNSDRKITGTQIKRGLTISQKTADTWLRKSLDSKYAPLVAKYDSVYHWGQNEFDALVSFAYNIGNIEELTAKGKRTRGEIKAAIPRYCKAGGRVVQGLKERREAELTLFCTPDDSLRTDRNPWPEPSVGTISSKEQAASLGLVEAAVVSSGNWVRWVQWELQRLGYNLAVDGVCGPMTVLAIRTFQMEAGLTVDGLCGPKTREALKAATERPALTITEEPDYKARVAAKAKAIYPLCVGKRHGGTLSKVVTSLDALKKYDALSCNKMVSIVLQEAGLLPKGSLVEHTKKCSGKKKITDAVRGTEKLKHCKVFWVNKHYRDLPEKWKQSGVVYIQDSNACISAGGGLIWSCNKSVGEEYKGKGDYLRKEGYPFTSKILCVIVPD